MESATKKNIIFSTIILLGILILQIVQNFIFYKLPITLDHLFFRALGAFLPIIAIPLLISFVAKLFKNGFFGFLWKSLAIISIPICVISFLGAYSKHNGEKKMTSSNSPIEYKPTDNEVKSFQTQVNSQIFMELAQINKAIKSSPTNSINYYNRGVIYTSQLEHEKAIEDYTKAIELDPNFSVAYLNRCAEYLFLNSLNKAFSDCSKGIQLNPNLSEAWFNRAKIRVHLGEVEESLNDMKMAAKLGNAGAIGVLKKNDIKWD